MLLYRVFYFEVRSAGNFETLFIYVDNTLSYIINTYIYVHTYTPWIHKFVMKAVGVEQVINTQIYKFVM